MLQLSPCLSIVLGALLSIAHAQNSTTLSPTSPTLSPTAFFTTRSLNYSYNGTFTPTLEPTLPPSSLPSVAPSMAPTIAISSGKSQRYRASITFRGTDIDVDWFDSALGEASLEIFIAASGLSEEQIQVAIGAVTNVYESETDDDSTRRRLLQDSNADAVIGVEVEYLASIDDARAVNTFEASFVSGSFDSIFSTAVTTNFEGVSVDSVTESALTDEGVGDGDAFLGAETESFGSKLLSPYIVLGIVCSSVGVVWLLFLRSDIDSKQPSYLAGAMLQPAGPAAVQMVSQTSQ